ncbi:hypothetical protein [Nocardioides sp. CER19]|uniref:hypothetical protein n=1 Tax=Nocardioides sp. CER19 TaxID=3038538 RepID=UPI00244B73FB|nr:hypothetical protein [Nocardioides sp. CER19]MDH2413343.1 hypothetical protein [Nocardioides sp. CER19]
MALSPDDLQLIRDMKQREFNLKKRQRASNAIYVEARRYRFLLILLTALLFAAVLDAILILVERDEVSWSELWRPTIVIFVVAMAVGILAGNGLMRTSLGRKLLANKDRKLNFKYSGDLHAGRRWQQFYYRGEDISAYIGQILYLVESEHRFESVDAALAFAKEHSRQNPAFQERGLELFNKVLDQTNLLVIASTDADGRPSNRFMRFVKTDRPGVWFMTTAPDAPKVHEFDQGRLALITAPTESGATVSSNRVRVRRAELTFPEVADLYRAQAPRYLEGMTEEDQQCELVYELTLESAKVSNWVDQALVVFDRVDSVD